MLDHQHLAQEALTVLLDAAFVEGNLECVVCPTLGVVVTILRPETLTPSVQRSTIITLTPSVPCSAIITFTPSFYLLRQEGAPGVDDTIEIFFHLNLYHHPLLPAAELDGLESLVAGLYVYLVTHVLLPGLRPGEDDEVEEEEWCHVVP